MMMIVHLRHALAVGRLLLLHHRGAVVVATGIMSTMVLLLLVAATGIMSTMVLLLLVAATGIMSTMVYYVVVVHV
jgi:hypothetical protein